MYRSLHFQLIAIVVCTVTAVLAISQTIDSHLTERAIEQDLRERAELVLRAVDSLAKSSPPNELRDQLMAMVRGDREIKAIDIFRLHDSIADLEVTTRDGGATAAELDRGQVADLSAHAAVSRPLPEQDGVAGWRISTPLDRGGTVLGAAQVDVQSPEAARLVRRIRWIDGALLASSIVLISGLLTIFLERRVARPVDTLVDGMRRVAGGDLGVRVQPLTGGEFRFLTERFNGMVARLQVLTEGLGEQVRRATADLAQKNVQLQKINDQLWQAQLELGRGERLAALGHMAGDLAHALGTPLNSVLGYVQLLRRETLAADQMDKLAIVESQIQRMIEDIRSVLDRTRDVPLRRTPVDLAVLAADAVSLVSARLAARSIALDRDFPPGLPTVPADAISLRQVLLNLLTNAIDATPVNGTIRLAARALSANHDRRPQMELTVSDSGHGMSDEELRRAFEPFYTTKAPERGSGLGLVIVEHIVRAHGGQVSAESVPGQGTTVRVCLPLEARDA
jgi:two-component system NtrC family sensor kinase